jgi:hypothetical protein
MTNDGVGQTVSSVDGPVLTVKYRDGDKKIIVGSSVPVTRLEVANKGELKSGVAVTAAAATTKPDGTFTAAASILAAATSCPERPAPKVSSGNYGPDRRSTAQGWRMGLVRSATR